MKKFVLLSLFVLTGLMTQDLFAEMYVGGSLSNMMSTNYGWTGQATRDPKYYLIDCSQTPQFCQSGNLKWNETNTHSMVIQSSKKMTYGLSFGYFNRKNPSRYEIEYLTISNTPKVVTADIIHGNEHSHLHWNYVGTNHLTITTLMINAYYGMKVDNFNPYFGIGVGQISGKASGIVDDNHSFNIKSGIGFQFIFGVETPISKGLYVGAEFRQIDFSKNQMTDSKLNQSNKLNKGNSSGLMLKVRYELNQKKYSKQNNKRKIRRKRKQSQNIYREDSDRYY